MNAFVFNAPHMLWLLPAVGGFAVLEYWRGKRLKQYMRTFCGDEGADRWWQESRMPSRGMLLILALILIIVALARPAWNPHPKRLYREGRDIVFLLDVSRSMLADDVFPNRLERAKNVIAECVDSLKTDRIGLVAFAGASAIQCPLTLDHDFFHFMLAKVGPDSVDQEGTRIGEALLKTCEKLFSDSPRGYRDIIMISDGEDHGEKLKEAVDTINRNGIRLIIIGIGDDKNGARIKEPGAEDAYLTYRGQVVTTRLRSDKLRDIARRCRQGVYIPMGTGNIHLDTVYAQIRRFNTRQLLSDRSIIVYDEKYQLFLGTALLILSWWLLIPPRKRLATGITVLLLFPGLLSVEGITGDAGKNELNTLKRLKRQYIQAIHETNRAELHYNLGNVCYRLGTYREALTHYSAAMRLRPDHHLAWCIRYNLANTFYRLAESEQMLEEKLRLLAKAIENYRKILRERRDFTDAAWNHELAMLNYVATAKKIEERERKTSELKKLQALIKERIEQLMALQEKNLKLTDKLNTEKVVDPARRMELVENEQAILRNTGKVAERTDRLQHLLTTVVDAEASVAGLRDALNTASTHEKQAIAALNDRILNEASRCESNALEALRNALQNLTSLTQEQQNEENTATSEQFDDSQEQEETDDDSQARNDSSNILKMNLLNHNIPVLQESPKDILERDKKIQKMRADSRSGKKKKSTGKNW
ncbi:MAG: VWA domain-containing protein [Lentisphaerae bacterium]|nr:MAG: VWA domain-containing protein [Lentisphaerota bacterium]